MDDDKTTEDIKKTPVKKVRKPQIKRDGFIRKNVPDEREKDIDITKAKKFFTKNKINHILLKKQATDLKVFKHPIKRPVQKFCARRERDNDFQEHRARQASKLDVSKMLTTPNLSDHLTTVHHKEIYKHLPLLTKMEANILFTYLETSSYKEVSKIVNVSLETVKNCIRKPLVQEYLRINFAEQARLHQTLNLRNSWDAVESLRTMIKTGTTETKEVISPVTGEVVKLVTKKSPNIDTIKFILERSGLMPTCESIEDKKKGDSDNSLTTEIDIHLKTVLK